MASTGVTFGPSLEDAHLSSVNATPDLTSALNESSMCFPSETECVYSSLKSHATTSSLSFPSTPLQYIWHYLFINEEIFEGTPLVDMIRSNMQVVATLCASYVMLLFWGQRVMRDRKSYDLKGATIAWNLFLAVFSFICFFKFTRETISVWKDDTNGGVHGVICHPPPKGGSHALWQLLFIASKVWEFGDTALLVLRKRPVIFLHWYHHMSVLMLSCFIGGRNSPLRRVFANVNSGIHAVMYTYYAFASAGIRSPKFVSMTITSAQLLQMVIGVYVCIDSLNSCNFHENSSAYFSLIIYFSYLVLFANFFYYAYMRRRKNTGEARRHHCNPNSNMMKNKDCHTTSLVSSNCNRITSNNNLSCLMNNVKKSKTNWPDPF